MDSFAPRQPCDCIRTALICAHRRRGQPMRTNPAQIQEHAKSRCPRCGSLRRLAATMASNRIRWRVEVVAIVLNHGMRRTNPMSAGCGVVCSPVVRQWMWDDVFACCSKQGLSYPVHCQMQLVWHLVLQTRSCIWSKFEKPSDRELFLSTFPESYIAHNERRQCLYSQELQRSWLEKYQTKAPGKSPA